ncbi:MAG: LysM peptidoglycan-binding domain-containing protein [Betaproteobacteria bacterium]|nr:LysM peptidoglycan-binding domain-containing protein [Betaproteobacteria bacterium]MDH4292479.1 LysM peptidoglycan-binding domain-containing protein [Betaproteobacteria bacterium]MDH5343700.1 LysM peptidoglycan-binding domain-containing protein [Betaproteobacteria bacterium]
MNDTAPERYTVQRGDTLWSISGRYLKEPWRWPELWKMNQEQVKNPHLIYPGDVIVLDRSGGGAQLSLLKLDTAKLQPKVRSEPSARSAVPSISPSAIEPFMSRPLVVGIDELEGAARIIAASESRMTLGAGDRAFVRGITKEKGNQWQIFRRGDALIDPETNEILGYEATYLGEARVHQHGDVATIDIVKSVQEVHYNDRLIPLGKQVPVFAYVPHPPNVKIKGRIINAYGGLQETGPLSIVTLSKGSRDGVQVGNVLAIERSQTTARYSQRTEPLYGRTGLSGSDSPRVYYAETVPPREVLGNETQAVSRDDIAKLPDDRYGLLMVFRTFDRASFALIMEASRPVAISDYVTNP